MDVLPPQVVRFAEGGSPEQTEQEAQRHDGDQFPERFSRLLDSIATSNR
jgi:hypothetical protein